MVLVVMLVALVKVLLRCVLKLLAVLDWRHSQGGGQSAVLASHAILALSCFSLGNFPGLYLIWLLHFLAFWPLAFWSVGFWASSLLDFLVSCLWLFGFLLFGLCLLGF